MVIDIQLPLIIFLATITGFFGVSFGLFLLYLTLKIKTEFRETLRYEIDKHRKMYKFIRDRRKVSVEELIEKFEGLTPEDMKFPAMYVKWQRFLIERIDNLKTLEGSKNEVSLSNEVKKFFVYDDPSLGDLFNYIFFTYIKRQPLRFMKVRFKS